MNYQDLQKRVQLAKEAGYSEADINAAIARKAGVQQQNYSQPQAKQKSGLGSVASAVGKFFAPQVSSIAQDVNASGKVGAYESSMGSRAKRLVELAQAIKNEKDPIRKMALVNESRAMAQGERPQAPEFSKNIDKSYIKRGLQTGLEVGSYTVPFGKGTNIASKALLPGAAVGGMNAAANDRNVITGALTGAAGAGVLNIAGTGVKKMLSGVTKKLPERMMGSVLKEPIKDTRAAIKGGDSLAKEALKRGIQGSDEKIYETSVAKLNQFEDEVQNALTGSKRIIPMADIKQGVQPLIDKYSKSGNMSAVSNITNRIEALEQYHGKSIPVSVANEVKRALYDEARNAYGQMSSENMEGVKLIAKVLKEGIANKVKGVDNLNKELSVYGRIADAAIDKLARGGRNNMLGLTDSILAAGGGPSAIPVLVGKNVVGSTAGKSFVANALNKAGNLPSLPGAAFMAGQAGARIPGLISKPADNRQGQTQQNSTTETPFVHQDSVARTGTGGQVNPPSQGIGNKPSDVFGGRTKQQVLTEALAQGAKPSDLKSISDVYDMVSGGSKESLSSTQINQVNLAKSGLRGLTKAEQILGMRDAEGNEILDGSVDMSILTKQLVPGQLMSRDYDAAAFAATEALLRARSGAAVPETEVKRYQRKLFPSFGDSEAVVKQKLTELRAIFGDMMNQRGAGVDPTELGISSPSNQFGGSY